MNKRHLVRTVGLLAIIGAAWNLGSCSSKQADKIENPQRGTNYFLYVVNSNTSQIHGHPFNLSTGAVSAASPGATAAAQFLHVATDPKGRFVFGVVNSPGAGIGTYRISSPSTGALTALSYSPVSPKWIAVHPSGDYLYYADGNNSVGSLTIDPSTGALSANGPAISVGATNPSVIGVDPSGKFAYVSLTNSDAIQAFSINSSNGQLTAVGAPIGAGSGPIYMAFDPSSRFLYVVGHNVNNLITVFAIQSGSGALTFQGSTVDATAGALIEQPAVDQSGKFLFVADGPNSLIHRYSINQTTGLLNALGPATPFGGSEGINPTGLVVSPNNQLIATGANLAASASQAAVFSIDPSGALNAVTGSPFSICYSVVFGAIAAVSVEY